MLQDKKEGRNNGFGCHPSKMCGRQQKIEFEFEYMSQPVFHNQKVKPSPGVRINTEGVYPLKISSEVDEPSTPSDEGWGSARLLNKNMTS